MSILAAILRHRLLMPDSTINLLSNPNTFSIRIPNSNLSVDQLHLIDRFWLKSCSFKLFLCFYRANLLIREPTDHSLKDFI